MSFSAMSESLILEVACPRIQKEEQQVCHKVSQRQQDATASHTSQQEVYVGIEQSVVGCLPQTRPRKDRLQHEAAAQDGSKQGTEEREDRIERGEKHVHE